MNPALADAKVLVLRRVRTGLSRGIRMEICDRGGAVLATVTEPPRGGHPSRRRWFSWDGFGDARTSARRVSISLPGEVPFLFVYKQWNALRRPIQIWDDAGDPLGAIQVTSWSPTAWDFAITAASGVEPVVLSGSKDALTVTDGGGQTLAEIFKEGDAQALVFRQDPPEPMRTLLIAALVTTRLVMWGARIADFA